MDFGVIDVVLIIALVIPVLHVLVSPRTRGADRVAWLIAVLAMSWMAYTVWLAATGSSEETSTGNQPTAS